MAARGLDFQMTLLPQGRSGASGATKADSHSAFHSFFFPTLGSNRSAAVSAVLFKLLRLTPCVAALSGVCGHAAVASLRRSRFATPSDNRA